MATDRCLVHGNELHYDTRSGFDLCYECEREKSVVNARAEPSRGAPDAAHTPGPWKYQEKSDAYTHIVRGPSGEFIASCPQGTDGEDEANARLIAQAPTLLAENEKLKSGHVVLLEALKAAKREMVGLAAYMETCEPSVIVDNLPGLAKALNLKVDAINAALGEK